MRSFFVFILCFVSLSTLAQDQDKAGLSTQEQMREAMKRALEENKRIMDKMMNSDFFQSMDSFKDQFFKDFNNRDSFFKGDTDFFKGIEFESNLSKKWVDKEEERVLVIEIGEGDRPIDIKIENGQIQLKGEVLKKEESQSENGMRTRQYTYQFNESFPIPKGLSHKKVKFEKKGKELWIRFARLEKVSIEKDKKKRKPLDKDFGLSI
ncbi:hypothetical protein HBN50_08305 [Halobacteriovorax sp. GB3]|uniref:hypothetical protein n=1 Tax=Halobacteriovorax sp. GB3 TaxID=2719615 RepID=UPI00235F3898|nr:hypothetical protein [Halobacteriovorax sp. GB3]MDD0853095.1 hypothetical protein [Halobacteriovorax sp. GB3]